ncbi:MAG: extracellular solute-binding protein [Candidatus Limnocylindrales bacterium]
MTSRWRLVGVMGVMALVFSACSGGGATASPSAAAPSEAAPSVAASEAPSSAPASQAAAPVTIEWWHISTNDPGKTLFKNIADAYMAAHPNVTINITVLENEAFKTKLATQMQSGTPPDLFQSWGGGTMAAQADAGMLKDITADVAPWKDTVNAGAMSIYSYNSKQYGVPWDMGMIGFWYNKKLFSDAGISAPPTTWDELLTDMSKLKAKGVAPLAIAGKDMWPSMHLWTYLVVRIGGSDVLQQMIQSGDWNTDACKAAGDAVLKLNALDPYQKGYASATYDNEAAAVGNGQAAMELMGQWAPGVQVADSTSKKGLGSDLGWFPFPAVTGGAGAATDGVGGGNGIAVGKNAPPEAVDFLKFFSSAENANALNSSDPPTALSPVVGTESTVTDANLQAVLAGRNAASFIQLYLDQATSPAMGTAINEATVALFLGKSTPEKVCQAITDAAATQ